MSNIRLMHPGYWGVVLGLSIPWYMGLGAGLLLLSEQYLMVYDYEIISRYIPLHFWGALYLFIGLGLFLSATIPKIPHKFVRIFAALGLCVTVFWLVAFIITVALGELSAYLLIPPFLTVALIEYRAVIESEVNESMINPTMVA